MFGVRSLVTKVAVAGGLAALLFGALGGHAAADSGAAQSRSSKTTMVEPVAFEPMDVQFTGLMAPAPQKPKLADFTPESPSFGIGSLTGHTSASDGVASTASFAGGRGGCSIQCIVSGEAYGHGTGAELRVETDTFAYISIWVWSDEAAGGSASSASRVKGFGTIFRDLKPGTDYSVMVEAKDYRGYRSYAYGSFTTMIRNVTVSFDRAELLELPYESSNTLAAYLWLDGAWRDELAAGPYPASEPNHPVDASFLAFGETSASLMNSGRYMDVALQLSQSKALWYYNCEVAPSRTDEYQPWISTIVRDCGVAITAAYATTEMGENDLDKGQGVSSWTHLERETVLMVPDFGGPTPDYGTPLDFEVPLKIVVEYVAP